jgi:hypothetical protein
MKVILGIEHHEAVLMTLFKDDRVVPQMVKELPILTHLIRPHLPISHRLVAKQASAKFNDISTSPLNTIR